MKCELCKEEKEFYRNIAGYYSIRNENILGDVCKDCFEKL
jgi:hypothetical protein